MLGLRQWTEAAAAYARAGDVSAMHPQDQLRRNLAANMADLKAYRPEVCRLVETSPADNRFVMDVTPSGRPTVALRDVADLAGTGPRRRLMEGDDPLAYLAAVMGKLKPARDAGHPLAIFGTGDGYLLVSLARHSPVLPLGRQQCVHYFEPNVGNLLVCLMIHDFSGETGPIRQRRFMWWVGPEGVAGFREAMMGTRAMEDLFVPFPTMNIATAPSGNELIKQVDQVLADLLAADARRASALLAREAGVTVDRLVDATSENPSRRPRIALLTTRFSTVLQYSTQDTAEGLRELGWDAQVIIEPSAYHTLTFPVLRESLLKFDPDVVLQLDHNRAEHGELFSSRTPFLCWTQDHLPNLTNPAAGAAMGTRDFLLTDLGPWYSRAFGYPGGNMMTLGKLTRVPKLPESWANDGPALTYVSTASKRPEVAAEELVAFCKPYPQMQKLGEAACRRLIEAYGQGLSFAGTTEVRGLVEQTAWGMGMAPGSFEGMDELVTEMFERVNNLCYRQQALGWVASAAEDLGVDLAIYGSGWEKHERFAKYARGYVAYGAELEKLTRASRINFQIVPYFCLHQRLLDGLAAGGFFLVRSHPSDTSIRKLAAFADEHLPRDVRDLDEARAAVDPAQAETLEVLARENSFIADRVDAIELMRIFQAQGLFANGEGMPPRIEEVSFANSQDLRARLARFLKDEPLRREIAMQQHRAVAEKLSYKAGMKRVMAGLHRKLVAERDRARGAA